MPIRPLSEVYLNARWSIQTNKSTFDPAIPSKERLCCPVLLQLDARHCDFTLSEDTHTQRLVLSVFLIHFQWHVGALCSATFIPAEDPYPSIQRWEMLLNGFFHTFRPLVTVWMPVGLCHFHRPLSGWHKVRFAWVSFVLCRVNGSFWFVLTISSAKEMEFSAWEPSPVWKKATAHQLGPKHLLPQIKVLWS